MPKAILMVGAPGAGKTKHAARLARQYNATLISSDATRFKVTGREDNFTQEQKVWSEIDSQMAACLRANTNVLLDATHSNSKRRAERAAFCRKHGATEVIVWWVDTPLARCIEQDACRERVVGEPDLTRRWQDIKNNPPIAGKDGITVVYRIAVE